MNKKSKILMMVLLITIFGLQVSGVNAQVEFDGNWQGHVWTVPGGTVLDLDDTLFMSASDPVLTQEGDTEYYRCLLVRYTPVDDVPEALRFTFSTPEPGTQVVLYVSDETNAKSILVAIPTSNRSLRCTNPHQH